MGALRVAGRHGHQGRSHGDHGGHQPEQRRRVDQAVRLALQMGAGAAPPILARLCSQTCGHRIHLDVPRCGKQMPVIQGKGGKSLLPEMATPVLAIVDVQR